MYTGEGTKNELREKEGRDKEGRKEGVKNTYCVYWWKNKERTKREGRTAWKVVEDE